MAAKPVVLQVITSTARRGAEVFAVKLEPQLIERGLRVQTLALTRGNESGLDVQVLGETPLGPTTLKHLRSAIRGAAVTIAHGSVTLPATAIASTGTRTPFIYRNIGDPTYWATSRTRRLRTIALLSRAAGVVALSETSKHQLSQIYRVPHRNVIPIPTGVATDEFPHRTSTDKQAARAALGYDDDVRLAVCVGALSPEKAVTDAIHALALLPERWHLAIAGDGPERPRIAQLLEAAAPGRVDLLGQLPDPAQLMTAADILILPSLTEGLPGVVIEAAMIGIPAVVTDVGYLDEIVKNDVSGMIVPPNDPARLAAGILSCEPRLDTMGAAAHLGAVDRYSLSNVAGQWYDVLAPYLEHQNHDHPTGRA